MSAIAHRRLSARSPDLVTDGSDGNWGANPLSPESSRFYGNACRQPTDRRLTYQPMRMRRTTTAAKRIRPSRVTTPTAADPAVARLRRVERGAAHATRSAIAILQDPR